MATTVRYHIVTVEVGAVTALAVGVKTGRLQDWLDPRDGLVTVRDKLAWLPRSRVRLVEGRYEKGQRVRVEVPDWLMKQQGLEVG